MTMRRVDHKDVLQGEYQFDEFKPDEINALLSHITPRACMYILSDHGRVLQVDPSLTPADPGLSSPGFSACSLNMMKCFQTCLQFKLAPIHHGFDTKGAGVERERWFNVPFKREPVEKAAVAAWEAAAAGPGRYCSPRHSMPFISTNEGSNTYR
jgi:hypothetical protein